jgi:multidrug efflux pump subunit AcrB
VPDKAKGKRAKAAPSEQRYRDVAWRAQSRAATADKMVAIIRDIQKIKARMRRNGERPRGGIHMAAHEEMAERLGIEVEALMQRIKRYWNRVYVAAAFGRPSNDPLVARIKKYYFRTRDTEAALAKLQQVQLNSQEWQDYLKAWMNSPEWQDFLNTYRPRKMLL